MMKKTFGLWLIFFMGLTAEASPLSEHISQQYRYMATAQQALTQQAKSFCQNPKSKPSKALRHSWRKAISAWMVAQHINIGPIATDNLGWVFQFWPDKKNLVKVKVEALLAEQSMTSPEDVAKASVIAQGYSALEFVLFDENAPDLSLKQSCAYLISTSSHLEKTISVLINYWSIKKNQEALDVNPSKASLVINAAATHVELIHKKLALPLSKLNPYFAESWRSRHSMENIKHNLEGLIALYQNVIRPWVLKNRNDQLKMRAAAQLDNDILMAFEKSLAMTKGQSSLLLSIKNKKTASTQKLEQSLEHLKLLLGEKLPQFLGIMIGFNSNDGD